MAKKAAPLTLVDTQNLKLAIQAHQNGDTDTAERVYRQILKKDPSHAGVNNFLGILMGQKGDFKKAAKLIQTSIKTNPKNPAVHKNLGNAYKELGDLNKSATSYQHAIHLKPDYIEAHHELGIIYFGLGKTDNAINCYQKTLTLNPNHAHAHFNLGLAYNALEQFEKACQHYQQSLALDPNNIQAQMNLGEACYKLGHYTEAITHFEQAIVLNPNQPESFYDLGMAQMALNQLNAAKDNYQKAILLDSHYTEAHNNLGFTYYTLGDFESATHAFLKAITNESGHKAAWHNLQSVIRMFLHSNSSLDNWIGLYKKDLPANILSHPYFGILKYQLASSTPHTADHAFQKVLKKLPSIAEENIANPKQPSRGKATPSASKKMIALLFFGRSGTGLMHSLIDNHPEISTLPSIYFSQFFNATLWKQLISEGWGEIPSKFIKQFDVLFDARSSLPVPSIEGHKIYLGHKEGMATVGDNKDQFLAVDRELFHFELKTLMNTYTQLNPMTFFTLVHLAYEKALKNKGEKHTIFYHIHNPDSYSQLNFLRYQPDTKLLMMVREPIQNCESAIKLRFKASDYYKVYDHILGILFGIDKIYFRTQNSIGVRLEDLKNNPKETMAHLCDWLGIEEQPSLYEMTAQGEKWWGDPTSPDYGKEGLSPFEASSIKRTVGSIFSEKDQYILRTLFYPFSVRFGYVTEDPATFKKDLQKIKPLLNDMFDFELKIAQKAQLNPLSLEKSGPYLSFRVGLQNRWQVLNEFNDYPYMLTPLKIKTT